MRAQRDGMRRVRFKTHRVGARKQRGSDDEAVEAVPRALEVGVGGGDEAESGDLECHLGQAGSLTGLK